MTPVRELLQKTGDEAAALGRTSDAATSAAVRFLLSKIKAKDHRALVKYLIAEGALDAIRDDFEQHRGMDVQALTLLVQTEGRSLKLAALVSFVFVLQSVAAGEPLTLPFSRPAVVPQYNHEIPNDDDQWLRRLVSKLTAEHSTLSVSEWAEGHRYLPRSVTPSPGFYSFDVAPFLREIADCLSMDSPVREFDFMKGAQIGATVGVLENALGYAIAHVKSAPCMFLTADAELAQLRVEQNIIPMLQHSKMDHLIRSGDETNKRKTGRTKYRMEWQGGGYMVPFGARNADKLRSISIQYLLQDEVDAFPPKVGKDGDPQKLAEARTKAYYESRKIGRMSTPLLKGSSRIATGYAAGDQRKYYVPCKSCLQMQVLTFQGGRRNSDETPYGLTWATDGEHVVPGSVRYVCKFCQFEHRNSDKAWMLPRGEWRATAKTSNPERRSYHLSALYSPVGFYPWEAIARDWLAAWDIEADRVRDVGLLQEFYNNNLGLPFAVIGSKVRFAAVSAHRRAQYRLGEVPNKFALQHSGSAILFLTCQVDVHAKNLAVAVMGWTRDARCYVIDYWRFETGQGEDDCSEGSSPVWGRLRELLEEKTYTADDGKTYNIAVTLVDAGYANDTVTAFCGTYAQGVYPILGRDRPAKNQTIKEFADFKTQQGTVGYRVLVDHYKDRMAPVLRREWDADASTATQKPYHFNAPVDITDKQLRELTVESRREKVDESGNTSYYWHRPGNARNELWDLLGYGYAAVEILAWQICIQHFEASTVDWPQFWAYIEGHELFYTPEARCDASSSSNE